MSVTRTLSTTIDGIDIVHPAWCDAAQHDSDGCRGHRGPFLELVDGFMFGWMSSHAEELDAPIGFTFLNGPTLDADALRRLAARLLEIAAEMTPVADRTPA